MKFTIDSSVFVADFMPTDPNHSVAAQFFHWIHEQGNKVVVPLTIPLEVINVVCRKTSPESKIVITTLQEIFFQSEQITVRELDLDFVQPFSEKCKTLNLKTSDAIIALTAYREESTLVSFDRELIRKAKKLIPAALPQALIPKNG